MRTIALQDRLKKYKTTISYIAERFSINENPSAKSISGGDFYLNEK